MVLEQRQQMVALLVVLLNVVEVGDVDVTTVVLSVESSFVSGKHRISIIHLDVQYSSYITV